jgi:acyl carrier protein
MAQGPRLEQQAAIDISIPGQRPEKPTVSTEPKRSGILIQLDAALPADRVSIVAGYVQEEVARVLNLDRSHWPDTNQRLMELGVDSLMAVELRNRISRGLQLNKKLTATLIYDYPTIRAIADYIAADILKLEMPESAKEQSKYTSIASVAEEIAQMNDTEVEDRLMEKLREI